MGRLQKKKSIAAKKRKKTASRAVAKKSTADIAQKKEESKSKRETSAQKRQLLSRKKTGQRPRAVIQKERNGIFNKTVQFLREVKVELKKVTWPSRKQALGSTVVVIILVMIISLFLGLVDIGLSSLVKIILQ
jgi:preprotein translocase subunit SecE